MSWDPLAEVLMRGGPWGIAVGFLWAFVTDRLITYRSHMREIGYLTQRADDFKAALAAEKEVSAEYRKQISILLGAKEPVQ